MNTQELKQAVRNSYGKIAITSSGCGCCYTPTSPCQVFLLNMTPEMVEKARLNAHQGGYLNVEFRHGDLESLPVADNSIDVIISNCVVNLAPDKVAVFTEALRVLKPGGRLMISDLVLRQPLPSVLHSSMSAYVGCIAGALFKEDYLKTMTQVGFTSLQVIHEAVYPIDCLIRELTDSLLATATDVWLSVLQYRPINQFSGNGKASMPFS